MRDEVPPRPRRAARAASLGRATIFEWLNARVSDTVGARDTRRVPYTVSVNARAAGRALFT
jgi:hypothetical protein